MRGILNEEYHQHYALLVGAIVTLSGRMISPAQLEKARKCLVHFVEMIDVYYGMNSNVTISIANVFACVLYNKPGTLYDLIIFIIVCLWKHHINLLLQVRPVTSNLVTCN